MRVITKKRINDFISKYPESQSSLLKWYRIVSNTDFNSFNELPQCFSNDDSLEKYTVFDISAHKYRLIAVIHYSRKIIYIRHVLTHSEYEKGKWRDGR